MKTEVKEYGHLATALKKAPVKPVLNVSAHVDTYGMPEMDTTFRKEELKRLRKEIKATSEHISSFDAEDVSTRALRSLKRDLAVKKARLMEIEALMDDEK